MLRSEHVPHRPEQAAHSKRVAYLCSAMTSKPNNYDDEILEICTAFDNAVEFAAYERRSLPEAIQEFFEEAGVYDSRLVEALWRQVFSRVSVDFGAGLPVLPGAVARLMRTSPETATVMDLESIAASDPVLAARLIGTANSACFGSRNQITSLRQAISRVGVPFARKVLFSASFHSLFASSGLKMLWHHSIAVAAAAHEIALETGCDQELSYLAGLLHDTGRLLTCRSAAKVRIREADYLSAGFPLSYAETLLYGQDHAALGATLLLHWGLPAEIADAVAHHHRPEATDSRLGAILCLAEDHVLDADSMGEALSRGMRRASAFEIAKLDPRAASRLDRSSAIFAIAG